MRRDREDQEEEEGVGDIFEQEDEEEDPVPGAGLAGRLWSKFKDEAAFALYSPFFVCLAAGDLTSQAFNNCLAQELHFIQAYVNAFDMAGKSSESAFEQGTLEYFLERESTKIREKERFIRRMSIEIPEEIVPEEETVKYTQFLLSIAAGDLNIRGYHPAKISKDGAFTLAAIAPCMRLYSYLCDEIKAVIDPNDQNHRFKKWFHPEGFKIYEGSALEIEGAMEFSVSDFDTQKFKQTDLIYREALKLDVKFYAAHQVQQRRIVPLVLLDNNYDRRRVTIFCEFDMTVTVHDSSYNLLMTPTTRVATSNGSDEAEVEPLWSPIPTESVTSLYEQSNRELEDAVEEVISNTPKANNFNYASIATLEDELKTIWEHPKRVIEKVENMQVLKGLSINNIIEAGENIGLYKGCRSFLQRLVDGDPKTDVHILSYSWCGDFIQSAFYSDSNAAFVSILSNELVYDGNITTGRIYKNLETPMQKVQEIKDNLKEFEKDDFHVTVYIGHSAPDLPCLIEANIGIVIGSDSCLRKLATHLGVSFVPLFSGLVRKQEEVAYLESPSIWKPRSGVLFTVSCWSEIHAFVLGCEKDVLGTF
ncbi:hypothetical protein UlMin_031759 [Ulmus minor]